MVETLFQTRTLCESKVAAITASVTGQALSRKQVRLNDGNLCLYVCDGHWHGAMVAPGLYCCKYNILSDDKQAAILLHHLASA